MVAMTTSLAAQLSQIAAKSTDALNLKAQKSAHSRSILFEPAIAASQDFDTIYQISYEGFQELCLLDKRFIPFTRTLFSEQSKEQDRTQMNRAENEELNSATEHFLGLIGGKLLLKPAVKALEWLIRRFRVHEHNTSFLLLTVLPYHTTPLFRTVLSILPTEIPQPFHFLHPYIRSLTSPPRHTIVHRATTSLAFSKALNRYVLNASRCRYHHHALLSFWAGVMTEAVAGMLDAARSGRKGVSRQNEEDVLLNILPTINDGLLVTKVPELRIACYLLLAIIVSKVTLEDQVIDAMVLTIIKNWSLDTFRHTLICLAILTQDKELPKLPNAVLRRLIYVPSLSSQLQGLKTQYKLNGLVSGLLLGILDDSRAAEVEGIEIVRSLLSLQVLGEEQIKEVVKAIIRIVKDLEETADEPDDFQKQLVNVLLELRRWDSTAGPTLVAMKEASADLDLLEMKLQQLIRPAVSTQEMTDVMEIDADSISDGLAANDLEKLIAAIPSRTADEVSFLQKSRSHIFNSLQNAFVLVEPDPQNLQKIADLPILQKENALDNVLFFSFFMRMWCGPYPTIKRSAALRIVNNYLKDANDHSIDLQALLLYVLVALADPAEKVRRAAADLIVTLNNLAIQSKRLNRTWGSVDLYGRSEESNSTKWLSAEESLRFHEFLTSNLEECILDKLRTVHIIADLCKLGGPKGSSKSSQKGPELKASTKVAIFSFLSNHAALTPLCSAKFRLLQMLNQVEKVGNTTKTRMLFPLLHTWASMDANEVIKQQQQFDQVSLPEYEKEMMQVITPHDKEGLNFLRGAINFEFGVGRIALAEAALNRIRDIWSSLKSEMKISLAQFLLDYSMDPHPKAEKQKLQGNVMDLLRNLSLPAFILSHFLDQLPIAPRMRDAPPSTKRRRTSKGALDSQQSEEVAQAIAKLTFTLELVDSAKQGKDRSLLKGLFQSLGELQHLKTNVGFEMAYLQTLILRSLLTIVENMKETREVGVDHTVIRADVVIDTLRNSSSPQVQNSALLLIASLATLTPELVLHSVMPIFTFMGSTVLRQDDDYSVHVIDKTIQQVIPPLIGSLREQHQSPVLATAELLLSFVAAFEHVPSHRRLRLYLQLSETLGTDEFLFALLAMLADKYSVHSEVADLAVRLTGNFDAKSQFLTANKYLDLVWDCLQQNRTISEILPSFSDREERDTEDIVIDLIALLKHLLSSRKLASRLGSALRKKDSGIIDIQNTYSELLEKILGLSSRVREFEKAHVLCGSLLETTLALLSTADFIKCIEPLLDRPDDELRRKVLKALELRIRDSNKLDKFTRTAVVEFLPRLSSVILSSSDVMLRHIAIACIDQLSGALGKQDMPAIADLAIIVAGGQGLGSDDDQLRIISLLCLSSIVDVLGQSSISMLPLALPTALEHYQSSLIGEGKRRLHTAACSFLESILVHIPWMITGDHLESLLKNSHQSAELGLGEEANDSRTQLLDLVAKQVEARECFSALSKTWSHAVETGILALRDQLRVLSRAIERHTKSTITKNSHLLSEMLLIAFDLRRLQSIGTSLDNLGQENLRDMEEIINECAIKMIFKLNDSTFRPIFVKVLEWAATGSSKKEKKGRLLRLTSVFSFFTKFFSTLKSIVTSYSTYVIDIAGEVLRQDLPEDQEWVLLWKQVIATLLRSFEHDQDEFWQSPAHFNAIATPLLAQLERAASLPIIEVVNPAIVELAACAVSQDHLKEMNAAIMKHLRADDAKVRLAAVKCEQNLTERLGEEWLSLLPEMLPFISELQEDDDEMVERETHKWILDIESILGESLEPMLQ